MLKEQYQGTYPLPSVSTDGFENLKEQGALATLSIMVPFKKNPAQNY
jgi:hypothetical protein